MKSLSRRFGTLVLMFFLLLGVVFTTPKVHAADAYQNLCTQITKGTPDIVSQNSPYFGKFKEKYTKKTYKQSGGGYIAWNSLVSADTTAPINSANFDSLTKGEKREFIEDVFTVANACAWETANKGVHTGGDGAVTDDTVNTLVSWMSDNLGMGGTLIASLLENTKPDFVSANRIYAPFSGVVGTVLGIISIVIMALLGVHMALDIGYIMIPTFQLICGSEGGDAKGGGKGNGLGKIISDNARNAVTSAGNGGGANGQDGGGKQAIGIYLKSQIVGLIILGIALLYLVSGNIYSLVGWLLDLVSGFLGF